MLYAFRNSSNNILFLRHVSLIFFSPNFVGLLPKEKALEPKTVRIVKRESTERRKDRSFSSGKKDSLSHLVEGRARV